MLSKNVKKEIPLQIKFFLTKIKYILMKALVVSLLNFTLIREKKKQKYVKQK